MYEQLLADVQRVLDDDHPNTLSTRDKGLAGSLTQPLIVGKRASNNIMAIPNKMDCGDPFQRFT